MQATLAGSRRCVQLLVYVPFADDFQVCLNLWMVLQQFWNTSSEGYGHDVVPNNGVGSCKFRSQEERSAKFVQNVLNRWGDNFVPLLFLLFKDGIRCRRHPLRRHPLEQNRHADIVRRCGPKVQKLEIIGACRIANLWSESALLVIFLQEILHKAARFGQCEVCCRVMEEREASLGIDLDQQRIRLQLGSRDGDDFDLICRHAQLKQDGVGSRRRPPLGVIQGGLGRHREGNWRRCHCGSLCSGCKTRAAQARGLLVSRRWCAPPNVWCYARDECRPACVSGSQFGNTAPQNSGGKSVVTWTATGKPLSALLDVARMR